MTSTTTPGLTLNNGVTMPALGLGVFQSPPVETTAAVEAPLREGYRLIDTAAAYGNEREVDAPASNIPGQSSTSSATLNIETPGFPGVSWDSGGRIRTCDLRVMSPTSYQTAPPRGGPTR
jgi:hypothetical protein